MQPKEKLQLFAGGGYLGSVGQHGAAIDLGARAMPIRHLALEFDAGYSVLGALPTVQDRWWLMPAFAIVLPIGATSFEIGAGFGLGASSGYTSASAYAAAPFTPVWAYQLVPAARVHAGVSTPLSRSLELFARADFGALVLGGTSIGSRVGNPDPSFSDVAWLGLLAGIRVGVL